MENSEKTSEQLAYEAGQKARTDGLPITANPHKLSHHERDTTRADYLNYCWYMGWECPTEPFDNEIYYW